MPDVPSIEFEGTAHPLERALACEPAGVSAGPQAALLSPIRAPRHVALSPERCATILGTLQQLNTASPDVEGCHQLLECVSDELCAESGVIILSNPLTRELEFVVHNQDTAIPRLYADYYGNLDPTGLPDCVRGTASPPGGPRFHAVSDLKDVIDYRWLVSTEFYNDFFRSAGIYYDLVALVSTPSVRGAVALHRAHSGAPFSAEEAAVLDMVAPFVGNHLERMASASVLSVFQAGADRGVILCDSQWRVLYCNDAARSFWPALSGTDAPHLVEGGSFIGYTLHNLEALAERCDVEVVSRDVVLDKGAPGRLVTLEHRSGSRAFRELLQQRFGLTEREVEVLSRVMAGAGNREIAQALFISEPTVKKHLQSISAKVGARTRTAIAHAVRQELGLTL
jgi:DNA-binding CsgD family transcriptional regulator